MIFDAWGSGLQFEGDGVPKGGGWDSQLVWPFEKIDYIIYMVTEKNQNKNKNKIK